MFPQNSNSCFIIFILHNMVFIPYCLILLYSLIHHCHQLQLIMLLYSSWDVCCPVIGTTSLQVLLSPSVSLRSKGRQYGIRNQA